MPTIHPLHSAAILGLLMLVRITSILAEPRGPIELPIDYPLTDVHLGLPAASPDILEPERQRAAVQFSWSTVSNYETGGKPDPDAPPSCGPERESCYVVDTEMRKANLLYRIGVTPNSDVSVVLPVIWRGGGILDSAIDEFHNLFGLPRGSRRKVEDDQSEVRGFDQSSEFAFEDHGVGLGNLVLGHKFSIDESESSRTSLQTLLSLPTARGSYGHKGVDLAFSILHRETRGDFVWYFGAGAIGKSDDSLYGLEYHRVHGEAFSTLEYLYDPDISLLIGLHGATKIVANLDDHEEYPVYLDTGAKADLIGLQWEVLFRQNLYPVSSTTDVAMMMGVGVEF